MLDLNTSKPLQYFVYLLLFVTGQSLSMWGQYVTLPYKNLTYFQGLRMAIPFAWADWFFMTFAIDIGHRYKLATPTQDTFLLIILQFTLVLLINQFYLKQKIYRSDIIAFLILLVGYFVSFFHLLSYALGKEVVSHTDVSPKESGKVTKEEQPEKSSKKSKRYNSTKVKKEKKNKKEEENMTCK
jgi:hypothetical protein